MRSFSLLLGGCMAKGMKRIKKLKKLKMLKVGDVGVTLQDIRKMVGATPVIIWSRERETWMCYLPFVGVKKPGDRRSAGDARRLVAHGVTPDAALLALCGELPGNVLYPTGTQDAPCADGSREFLVKGEVLPILRK